jgi:hypothetical protein
MNTPTDPFAALGLPVRADLDDEQVRAAWRAIATTTHPDRSDGGDPARYAAASAAYAVLRTAWGRSEAYADLIGAASPLAGRVVTPAAAGPPAVRPRLGLWRALVLVPARIWHGRPARLLVRVAVAAVLGVLAFHTGAGSVPAAALVTGIGIWLVLTVRADLAPPPGR